MEQNLTSRGNHGGRHCLESGVQNNTASGAKRIFFGLYLHL